MIDKKDFAIGWVDEEDTLFIRSLRKEAKARGVGILLVNEDNVREVIKRLKAGELQIRLYLDMASEFTDPKDRFSRLCYAAKDAGSKVVDDPDNTRQAADKSITHFDLVDAGIPVPYTVVIRNWEPARKLTEQERKRLGSPFIIKPALGFGQKGVKVNAKGSLYEIAKARNFNRGDNFLLQEKIVAQTIEGKMAWFRVYHLFGEIIPCWWDTDTHHYEHVSLRQMYEHNLLPLARIASEIARLKNMDWFSTEIAIDSKSMQRSFVVIDYVNDQCDVKSQSLHKDGVPDDVIEHIAYKIIENAWLYSRREYKTVHRTIFCAKAKYIDENI